jgi:spore coat protein U-like protein
MVVLRINNCGNSEKNMPKRLRIPFIAAFIAISAPASFAVTATGSFNVQVIIQETCIVTSPSTTLLDFGTQTLINANVDAATTIAVQCTSGTDYDVSLNQGLNTSRRMILAGNFADYELYKDAARSTIWPATAGSAPYFYVANGNAQNITVYGRMPIQTTPPASVSPYTDTVGITVTY